MNNDTIIKQRIRGHSSPHTRLFFEAVDPEPRATDQK
jgi:hypothetical protein